MQVCTCSRHNIIARVCNSMQVCSMHNMYVQKCARVDKSRQEFTKCARVCSMHHLRSVKPPHVQPPFNGCFLSSSARRRPIFLILNSISLKTSQLEKSKTIYKRIRTRDQNCPLYNFLKDQADKQYLIAILGDFFNLRKLKRILLSSADKIECGLSSAKG